MGTSCLCVFVLLALCKECSICAWYNKYFDLNVTVCAQNKTFIPDGRNRTFSSPRHIYQTGCKFVLFVSFPCANRSCIAILDHFSVFSPCVLWRIFIQGVYCFIVDLNVSTLCDFTYMCTGCEALHTFICKKVPLATQKVDARSCKEQQKRGFPTVCEFFLHLSPSTHRDDVQLMS